MYLTISTRWGLTSLSISNESSFCLGSFCAKCTFGFWFCLSGVEKVSSIPLSSANKICLLQRRGILIQSSSVLSVGWDASYSSLKPSNSDSNLESLTHNISTHQGHDTTRFFSTERASLFSGMVQWKYPFLVEPMGAGNEG